jgi:SWI/SNF-related matrix-associated actin-dependent regulator 1 of chromatin subfamily A
MGLGKTIEFIGWVNYITVVERLTNPQILLLCPAKLMYMWEQQLHKWLVHPLTIGVSRQRIWPDTNIRILNFENLWYFEPELRAHTWDLMGVDEAHFLMNPKAERTRFVFGWTDPDGVEPEVSPIPCDRAMFMTGTPIRNRPMEVFPLAHYLDPVAWPSATAFAAEFCQGGKVLIKKGKHAGQYRLKAGGAANLSELQARLRATIMLRRLKKDALHELYTKCPKTRKIINLPCTNMGIMSTLQEELDAWKQHEVQIAKLRLAVASAKEANDETGYANAVSQMKKQVSVSFAEMSKFRKKTALLKVPFVIAHIEAALAADPTHKIVAGAHHQEVLDAIQEHFTKAGIDVARVDGRTNPKRVTVEENRFQTDPGCRLFLLSILCGTGLTLTAAHHAVLAELDWVPGNLMQWEDRIHRIGQYFPCLIEHLVIERSLDSYLCPKILQKLRMLDLALNSDAGNTRQDRRAQTGATATQNPANAPSSPNTPTQGAGNAPRGGSAPTNTPTGAGQTAQTAPKAAKAPSTDPMAPRFHRALQALAARCDNARSVDGAGFSKHDVDFGKSLAGRPALTDNMLLHAARLIIKYRRQLPADVVANADKWMQVNGGRK